MEILLVGKYSTLDVRSLRMAERKHEEKKAEETEDIKQPIRVMFLFMNDIYGPKEPTMYIII